MTGGSSTGIVFRSESTWTSAKAALPARTRSVVKSGEEETEKRVVKRTGPASRFRR